MDVKQPGKKGEVAGGDLFSELQSSELEKFKADLEIVEMEKLELQRKLEETQRSSEVTASEVSSKTERINQLLAELDVVLGVQKRADAEFNATTCASETGKAADNEVGGLKRALRQTETRYSVAMSQIASMQHDLWRLKALEGMSSAPEAELKTEVLHLRDAMEKRTAELKVLENKVIDRDVEAREVGLKSAKVSIAMRHSFSQLLRLYQCICSDLKETPAKQVAIS